MSCKLNVTKNVQQKTKLKLIYKKKNILLEIIKEGKICRCNVLCFYFIREKDD